MIAHSYLYNAAFIDDLYEAYLVNPLDVSEECRDYFTELQQEDQPQQAGNATCTDSSPL
ncbi:hypothetical protein BGS_0705 [Beggiatoa sp. SS]|nr:hypothetical protein BGS_0705 [Beggiatoa sp. SS]